MHLSFAMALDAATATEAGQIHVVRDPEDESEWQYLGNPQVAARTTLEEVVARFIRDCSGDDGLLEQRNLATARRVRDALRLAALQIDEALERAALR